MIWMYWGTGMSCLPGFIRGVVASTLSLSVGSGQTFFCQFNASFGTPMTLEIVIQHPETYSDSALSGLPQRLWKKEKHSINYLVALCCASLNAPLCQYACWCTITEMHPPSAPQRFQWMVDWSRCVSPNTTKSPNELDIQSCHINDNLYRGCAMELFKNDYFLTCLSG